MEGGRSLEWVRFECAVPQLPRGKRYLDIMIKAPHGGEFPGTYFWTGWVSLGRFGRSVKCMDLYSWRELE